MESLPPPSNTTCLYSTYHVPHLHSNPWGLSINRVFLSFGDHGEQLIIYRDQIRIPFCHSPYWTK
jgi:hypothetical protein